MSCECVIKNRKENEEQRDWLKRCMCMFHWMQTDYYRAKTGGKWVKCPDPKCNPVEMLGDLNFCETCGGSGVIKEKENESTLQR